MHDPLIVPDEYIATLEEVLSVALGKDAVHSRATKQKLQDIARSVQTISEGLTQDRDAFVRSKYLKKQDQRKAYLLYYVTTNFLKLWPPLRELAQSGFFERKTVNHLDLGSGPGTAAFGLWSYLHQEQSGVACTSFLTDSLTENLSEAERSLRPFASKLSTDLKLTTALWDLRQASTIPSVVKSSGPYDLITMMNVVNELEEVGDAQLIDSLRSVLGPTGAIIMIEPATRIAIPRSTG
jgi:ribosomal protein RSM22 (predicted rRNA methylase)